MGPPLFPSLPRAPTPLPPLRHGGQVPDETTRAGCHPAEAGTACRHGRKKKEREGKARKRMEKSAEARPQRAPGVGGDAGPRTGPHSPVSYFLRPSPPRHGSRQLHAHKSHELACPLMQPSQERGSGTGELRPASNRCGQTPVRGSWGQKFSKPRASASAGAGCSSERSCRAPVSSALGCVAAWYL